MALTQGAIKALKPKSKTYTAADPEFTLAEARDARNGLARDVVRGINPKAAIEPELDEADLLLRPFAERYYREVVEVEMKHSGQTLAWIEKDILPHLVRVTPKGDY